MIGMCHSVQSGSFFFKKIEAGHREMAWSVRALAVKANGPEFKFPAPTLKIGVFSY